MTKHEFMERLTNALKRNGIEDISEIIDEYEQHFAFKMADGFCEAEIAAKLGDPLQLAAQFCGDAPKKAPAGKRVGAIARLCFTGFWAGVFFILLCSLGCSARCMLVW